MQSCLLTAVGGCMLLSVSAYLVAGTAFESGRTHQREKLAMHEAIKKLQADNRRLEAQAARVQGLLLSNKDKDALVEELHKQVQQLQASQDTLQELLNDEEVQQVSCMLRLGLSTRSGFSVAPILSVIQFSEVQKMLSDACQDVAQAVEGIAAYLANTAPLLDAFLQAPVFRLGSEVQIFSGKKCKDSRQTIAKAVGLALVAAQDHLLRAELLVQLQDRNKWTGFSGDAAAAASFAELNTSLYNSNGGEQQGRQKGLVVQDVLLFCLRKHCSHSAAAVEAASNKTERVAAALLLGLLMKAGLMK